MCGLTATPIRADGHQAIIFLQCGPIRYRVDAKEQAEKRDFEHYIILRFTPARIPDAALTIQEIYAKLVASDTRNHFIIKDVISALNEGRSPIVLTERWPDNWRLPVQTFTFLPVATGRK